VSQSEFEEFARRELPRLLRYAVMLTGDSHLAQDLVQDVMVKVHTKWRSVAAADHPQLYVKTMITRAFISWRRRWAVRSIVLSSGSEIDGEPGRRPRGIGRRSRRRVAATRDPASSSARRPRTAVLRRAHRSGNRRHARLLTRHRPRTG
jgi:DNA-directed RNA polymerase specialized sigma24 family protein